MKFVLVKFKSHLIVDVRRLVARVFEHENKSDKLLAVLCAKLHFVRLKHLSNFGNRVKLLGFVADIIADVPHMLRAVGIEIRRPKLLSMDKRLIFLCCGCSP